MAVKDRETWLRETLESLGYELVDMETSRGGHVRVFIDSPRGITVDDCARVSNHLTRVFAVEGTETLLDLLWLEAKRRGFLKPLWAQTAAGATSWTKRLFFRPT